ncbi:MAG: SDR family oxidoreductase [Candidatus Omnitrophica bacterium]|nr:SDR family oxidoreductase [Candidatus Omnitrophota bacterium]
MSLNLVTGGAGFIGSNIVEALLSKGETVRVLDSFITGSRHNLDFTDKHKNRGCFELIKGDIRSKAALRKALKGVDYVFHQAALRSVPKSVDDPFLTNDINVNGTLMLLFAAKQAGVKRFVYASSSACYGDTQQFPQREDFNPRPISPYGVSKLAAENYCHTFSKTYGLETVSLRYFNVFGPRQNPESRYSAAIPALLSRMLNDKPPVVEWDGEQSRDFVYVGDVVNANIICAHAKAVSGSVFNVGLGNSVSILCIVDAINKLLGTCLKPEFAPKRSGDVRRTYADITGIQKVVSTRTDFYEGLRLTVEWFKNNPRRLVSV